MRVSFIIRTLNEGKTLGEVLRRIHLLIGDFNKEIVIVDSGSKDNTLEIAKAYKCKILTISPKNWSWGRALNEGIKNSSGEIVAIISGHCFITKKDFLIKACVLLENKNVAAVYGRQLPVEHTDPFEEYELFKWYPDIFLYVMNARNKNFIGVSNACCVLKRKIWEKIKFNEEAKSLEDGIWAYEVINRGYDLIYSSQFTVYHSHPFDPGYIYRKWYWRNYEGLRLKKEYLRFISLKQKIKNFIKRFDFTYRFFLDFKKLFESKEMEKFLSIYNYINKTHIRSFLKIKYNAILNSHKDFLKQKRKTYWSLKIPLYIIEEQKKLENVRKCLDRSFSYLRDIE